MNPPAGSVVDEVPRAPTDDVPNRSTRREARVALLLLVVAGIAIELVLRSDVATVAGTAAVVSLALVVRRVGVATNPVAVGLLVLGAGTSVFLALRTSPWLVPLDVLVALGLGVLAAILARSGSVVDLPFGVIAKRSGRLFSAAVEAPAVLLERLAVAVPVSSEATRERLAGVARGVGLALPVVVVLGLLLASADAVFASFFSLPGDPGTWLGHGVMTAAGVWIACAAARLALDEEALSPPAEPLRLGAVEATIVLGGLVVVYGLFVVAQVVAAGAGEAYIVETTGLTRAEYARSGFFQLLWAAGLTLAVILGVHRATGRSSPRHLGLLSAVAVGLTLVVVVVAIRRLGLYEDAFGLTMLRLYSTVFAWWLGLVMVLSAVYVVAPWRRSWLAAGVGATGLAVLVALNVVNPERLVVEHNLARAMAGEAVDVGYLAGLSDDAVPTLVAARHTVPPAVGEEIEALLCRADRGLGERPDRWYAHNRSTARAADAIDELCGVR